MTASRDPQTSDLSPIGLLGAGTMGRGMCSSLLKADYRVIAYDPAPASLQACVSAGAEAADNEADVVAKCPVVLMSLPSSAVFVEVADGKLLPAARAGQVFVDMGTTEIRQTERIAAELAGKGAFLLDAPVSGGGKGAEAGELYIFVGGQQAVFERVLPVLQALGSPEHITYCGPSGAGQAVKAANQLALGLVPAACLEAVAFAVRCGVQPGVVARALDGEAPWRRKVAQLAGLAGEGRADTINYKFPELPYFLGHAEASDFAMPMTKALYEFCKAAECDRKDNMSRPSVALWRQLMRRPYTD